MWKCECGEKIEDQFDACWKCAGTAAGAPRTTEEPVVTGCPHCKIDLDYLGKKRFYDGGHLTRILAGNGRVGRQKIHAVGLYRGAHVGVSHAREGRGSPPKTASP